MKPETASWLRKFFLVLTVIFDLLMFLFWWLGGHTVFFWVFVVINVAVIVGEIVNTLWVYKKTISTQITKTVEQGGKKELYSKLAVLFMCLAILCLAPHFLIHVKP